MSYVTVYRVKNKILLECKKTQEKIFWLLVESEIKSFLNVRREQIDIHLKRLQSHWDFSLEKDRSKWYNLRLTVEHFFRFHLPKNQKSSSPKRATLSMVRNINSVSDLKYFSRCIKDLLRLCVLLILVEQTLFVSVV